jgi:hypothetical protein
MPSAPAATRKGGEQVSMCCSSVCGSSMSKLSLKACCHSCSLFDVSGFKDLVLFVACLHFNA